MALRCIPVRTVFLRARGFIGSPTCHVQRRSARCTGFTCDGPRLRKRETEKAVCASTWLRRSLLFKALEAILDPCVSIGPSGQYISIDVSVRFLGAAGRQEANMGLHHTCTAAQRTSRMVMQGHGVIYIVLIVVCSFHDQLPSYALSSCICLSSPNLPVVS